ncbi:DUF1538 domain-containing protein [Fibrobacter sp.]|uniref:DUF1538 domain-containing protein n=1 Tax=Fibrobacter sp. TaxID=35828 RepID=UPI0025BB48D1|nr:DUF1538 domain-containing protein [Fibrobacter sp.]
MQKILFEKLKEAFASVLPITLIVLLVSHTPLVSFSVKEQIVFSISAVFLIVGIGLFNLGADLAMTPMGAYVGSGLTKSRRLLLLVSVCFVMGVLITVAEPDLSVLAEQVKNAVKPGLLIATIGVGVGLFLLLAILKIVFKKDLSAIIIFFYMVLFMLGMLMVSVGRNAFVPLAFDSGGVTTGPITVPFIMALGVGVAGAIGGKNASENSFGLIALCSVGPIIALMGLVVFSKGDLTYELSTAAYSVEASLGEHFLPTIWEVAKKYLWLWR